MCRISKVEACDSDLTLWYKQYMMNVLKISDTHISFYEFVYYILWFENMWERMLLIRILFKYAFFWICDRSKYAFYLNMNPFWIRILLEYVFYSPVQQVFGHSKRGASARWQRRAPHQFPHRRDRTSQHSSSIKSINNALKIIRIGDSESPRRAPSNGIALIRLYDKVKSPCSHSQLETPGTLPPLPPWAAATLCPHGQCFVPAVIQEW